MRMMMKMMMRRAALLLVLALTGVCNGILPELVNPGVGHILVDDPTQQSRDFVEVEQLPLSPHLPLNPHVPISPHLLLRPHIQIPQDQDPQLTQDQDQNSQDPELSNQLSSVSPELPHNQTAPDVVTDLENNNISSSISSSSSSSELENSIDHGCINDADDCGKTRYCVNSKCTACKATDVSCSEDGECCGEQLCVWGQCSENGSRGDAGTTCRHQSDCGPELCCALHKALLFSVCSAKPIERERCFSTSNHLMELLSWDSGTDGPRKHCPCAGQLHCQHLGRGSMCLKREDSSEEDLSDSLYSDIDYII